MIIKEEVKKLLERGLSVGEIAERTGRTRQKTHQTIWTINNAAYVAKRSQEYDKHRYGTEAYRKWNREWKAHKYHVDPLFRQAHLDTVKRSKAKRRQGVSEHA